MTVVNKLYIFFLKRPVRKNEHWLLRSINWQLFKYLRHALPNYYKRLPSNQLSVDKTSDVVVSLTSIPKRIETVHLVIKSILNQTYKPSKVILWLGQHHFPNKEEDVPNELLALKNYGLDIEFCLDLKPHTKYYYAFKTFQNQRIVTVDDDIIYPTTMLEKLIECHKKYPNSIIANRIRTISITDGKIDHYRKWRINQFNGPMPSKQIMATGVGGVLYTPTLFTESVYDKEIFLKIAANVDDIWLKANQLASGIPVVWTNYFLRPFMEITDSQEVSLNTQNVFEGGNNDRIKKIFSHFKVTSKTILDN